MAATAPQVAPPSQSSHGPGPVATGKKPRHPSHHHHHKGGNHPAGQEHGAGAPSHAHEKADTKLGRPAPRPTRGQAGEIEISEHDFEAEEPAVTLERLNRHEHSHAYVVALAKRAMSTPLAMESVAEIIVDQVQLPLRRPIHSRPRATVSLETTLLTLDLPTLLPGVLTGIGSERIFAKGRAPLL